MIVADESSNTEQNHILYRFFDENSKLLYVGITADPSSRLTEHCNKKTWWNLVRDIKLESFPSRHELMRAERNAIQGEEPLYNVQHSRRATKRKAGWGSGRLRKVVHRLELVVQTRPIDCPVIKAAESDRYREWLIWQWWLYVSDPDHDRISTASTYEFLEEINQRNLLSLVKDLPDCPAEPLALW